MSEGTYGQSRVLGCGCVGACTCFSEPYQHGNHWYTQDANGHQYLWTGSGWVNASSAEAQSVLAADTSGVTQHWANPASGALHDPASGTIYQSGGYWYTQGSDGHQYAWTTSGWLPAAPGYVDPAATPAGAAVGPPTVGASTGAMQQEPYEAAMLASDDPEIRRMFHDIKDDQRDSAQAWINNMLDPGPDSDGDKVHDDNDFEPLDSDVQSVGDPDPFDM